METVCIICKQLIATTDDIVTLTEKGANGINKASLQRCDDVNAQPGNKVHIICRRNYCLKKYIEHHLKSKQTGGTSDVQSRTTRSSVNKLACSDSRNACLFCGQAVSFETKHSGGIAEGIKVRTHEFQNTITAECHKRNDDWSTDVLGRVNSIISDLHAADAVYHRACSINFRTCKQIPKKYSTSLSDNGNPNKRRRMGRPIDEVRFEAFTGAITFVENNDDEQWTLQDIQNKMEELLHESDVEPYGKQYLKQEIKHHYGERILITDINGKQDVITFRETAKAIMQEYYNLPKQYDVEQERKNLVEAVGKLLANEMKVVTTNKEEYHKLDELTLHDCLEFMPPSLRLLLSYIIPYANSDIIIPAIGQAIIQAARPRAVTAPMQIGLAIQLHHHFRSRFLIETLNKLGFCSSYKEVLKFERCAAACEGQKIKGVTPDVMVHYIADNIDHDICTIDGRGTFHGMGIVAAMTPAPKESGIIVPRVDVSADDIHAIGTIVFHGYQKSCNSGGILYSELPSLSKDISNNIDILWYSSWFFKQPRPGWSGFMQSVHDGPHPGKAALFFLPMIDHNPSDLSCVYSTLLFVCSEANKYKVTPIVTFDQPLYWKAVTIINAEPSESILRNLVVLLGGFHTRMSFLGAIGYVMQDTGLAEVLETVYAGHTVKHILSGKAVSRAIRAHSIVDMALNIMLFTSAYGVATDCTSQMIHHEDIDEAAVIYEGLCAHTVPLEECASSEALRRISEKLNQLKDGLHVSRTAKLWLQYMGMVSILRRSIRAERSGDWNLYLNTLAEMLPYFAATGHTLYTKSVRLHLQNMHDLKLKNPPLYARFLEGNFVIRRSDRFWAGLSPDLVIEQSLMRSLKTTGGLTRGSGMTENQRSIWTLSMPICAQINESMQNLTGLTFATSEQHVETSQSRIHKDTSDTESTFNFLMALHPFRKEFELCNITTGMTAAVDVNVDNAKDVGKNILADMTGKMADAYTFKKKYKAVPMGSHKSLKIDGESVHIDQALLFQRLATIVSKESSDMQDIMSFELCTYPPALFQSYEVLRSVNKSSLATEMWKFGEIMSPEYDLHTCQCVIDGGWLLYKIPWEIKKTYDSICDSYVTYVSNNFGKAYVVFDGYKPGPATKDLVHLKRTRGLQCPTIQFTGPMQITMKKEEFLRNPTNKERIIRAVGMKLSLAGCTVSYASGDADVLIAMTAVTNAKMQDTCLVGNDTDLLVLMLYHADTNAHHLYFKTETKIWNINRMKEHLGNKWQYILFIHAFLGCDTTSGLFGIGKKKALTLGMKDKHFQEASSVFSQPRASKEALTSAGELAMVRIYNGKLGESLASLRHRLFLAKIASSSSFVQPERLPPTPGAAKFHYFRTYLQVMEWKQLSLDMRPEDWGWRQHGDKYVPIMTEQKPAPETILRVIRCNCKSGCDTVRCSCRKQGLPCTLACGICMGTSCLNCELVDAEIDD